MLHEEVKKYRELSGDTNPNTPISRIGGYLDGYEKALEQKTGHWITGRSIYYDVEMYRCSECKNWSPYKAEKCPNCHVRMLGEKE